MRLPPSFFAVLTLLGAGAACGNSSNSTSSGTNAPKPGPVARFNASGTKLPDFMEVPFPSDVYLQGGKVATIPNMAAIVTQNSTFITDELSTLDGFSRTAMSLFYVDDTSKPAGANGPAAAAIDASTLPASETACVADTSAIFVLDLLATDPAKARVPCRGLVHQDVQVASARPLVAVGPAIGVVLQPGHPYAAVLTSRVHVTGGHLVQPSPDFEVVKNGGSTAPAVYRTAYQTASKLLSSAFQLDGAEIVSIAPFTTSDAAKDLYALRDGIERAPAPALQWDPASMAPMVPAVFAAPVGGKVPSGAKASLDAWLGIVPATAHIADGSDDPDTNLPVRAHDAIAEVGTGVFIAQNWLTGYQGATYQTSESATFSTDPQGAIQAASDAPTDKIWVSFAVPTAAAPASGYPVVIFQHGLGGSREDFLGLANPLCKQGWMVAAIDSITFGARAPEAIWQVDAKNDFAGSPGATYTGPDGFGDADSMGNHNASTDLFGGLLDLGAVRDQFRQAELDTAQLVRMLTSNPDLSGLALGGGKAPALDGTRIAYVGQSLGAIEGAVAAAIEPHVKGWVLNVAGGGLILELGTHGPIVGGLLAEAGGLNFGFTLNSFDEGHPMTTLLQTVVEPGDPLAYAGYLVGSPQPLAGQATSPRNILQVEVLYDEWVPNESNEALARAGGWGLGSPNLGSNADILNIKSITANAWRAPLQNVSADASGHLHDTPMAGVTAVLVQSDPATHGDNLTASSGTRSYCIPFANFSQPHPFSPATTFTVTEPYLQTQAVAEVFLAGALGGQVPIASVPVPPVRDLDGDGVLDDVDPAPCDPHQK